ncbi:hypothetical protein [Mycobacterium sp. E787]|uniref:hypothetical protein n=1 Tax=Mycobacterium sp. E787 TaxID=1834150 RepID=UPI0012EA6CF2|nr:hypothetical protein [Mycobacterium sp. E787]
MPDAIDRFMWGFQSPFRGSVEIALRSSLEALGVSAEPTVFLIGLPRKKGSGHPLCVEPEDGLIVPADFDGLFDRAAELYRQNGETTTEFSSPGVREKRHQELRHRAYTTAIGEVLEGKLRPGLRLVVGLPAPVEQHLVFAAIGLPDRVHHSTPHLLTTTAGGHPVTPSLVHGAVDEILRLSRRALYEPHAGSGLSIGHDPADVARAAGRALTRSATLLAGNDTWTDLFDGLNRVSTTRYETRVGVGSLLLADARSEHIDRSVTLRSPVPVSETRTLRKLLETSSFHGESLLTDGNEVYGFGRQRPDYPETSESVFQVVVLGDGIWELSHAGVRLVTVQFGAARLPDQPLPPERLDDLCGRVFQQYDGGALWDLATAASRAAHGTMLVISERAAEEAARLESQALTIEPTRLDQEFVGKVTGIDGAVLVDPSGYCHAIGVILDGTATSEGDRSRGARYNSAVKYLAHARDARMPTVILLVSEDGMINLLPDLRPRMRRSERDALLAALREAAAIDPVHPEEFYKAYRRIEAKAFYLSPDQISEVNALMDDHWERRMADGANVRTFEHPLRADPEMTEEYLID